MKSFVQKMIGSEEDRRINRYRKVVDAINALDEEMGALSDQELQAKTDGFRERLEAGEALSDMQVEAFAVVREAGSRVIGLKAYDVQLMGGLALCDNDIAEMATGEGKTLVAAFPSYYRALEGKGVHVITVNDYLARRDQELIGQIHRFLGLTVGLNSAGLPEDTKRAAYESDITYGVAGEFGFDHLRDHMVTEISQRVRQRPYHYAIIDEVDSVLIDEARTPLIIAGKVDVPQSLYGVCAKVAGGYKEDRDYIYDREARSVMFTESGIATIERVFGIDNLYDIEHQTLYHYMLQALRARVMYKRDVEYIVEDGEVRLVDMFTGRTMEGRTLSDGLHQAIEAKEGVPITPENKTQATITIQNFFRMYENLSGMTGTAKTEKREFKMLYGMQAIPIPTHKTRIRTDQKDHVYVTKEDKYRAMVKKVRACHDKRQPVLVGTTSIIQSEDVAGYLDAEGLPYELLNAKSVEKEVELIAKAGQAGRITIATNMAGRGTDITLDDGAKEAGGLFVLGTEKHESRRIDNQLRGRSGRQGDPGETVFYVSVEDDMMKRFAKEDVLKWQETLKTAEDGLILDEEAATFIEKVQKMSEDSNYAMREYTLKLDDVLNEQRGVIYEIRDHILNHQDMEKRVMTTIQEAFGVIVDRYCPEHELPDEWDLEEMTLTLSSLIPGERPAMDTYDIEEKEDVLALVNEWAKPYMAIIEAQLEEERAYHDMKQILLSQLDRNWLSHIERMSRLKEGIGLRSYQQEDPMRIYLREGFDVFQLTFNAIRTDTAIAVKRYMSLKYQDALTEAGLE